MQRPINKMNLSMSRASKILSKAASSKDKFSPNLTVTKLCHL